MTSSLDSCWSISQHHSYSKSDPQDGIKLWAAFRESVKAVAELSSEMALMAGSGSPVLFQIH